ncbi:MAG TPA: TetR/AcrR family transcriptional regulator C-terminal domain-containing protein [Jatrophihabitans sp.]|nr:TetR/AcrR family transcriptional regulator C-terminal domain-containing protein [Jatrophihabitans sp.]
MARTAQEKVSAKRAPITTELLVDTAIDLIETDGLEALSMRRLADRFGIQAASVYWYVASKEHMLDLVVDRLLGLAFENVYLEHVEQRGPEDEPAEQRLRRLAVAYRSFLLAHPDSAKVISSRLVIGPNLALLIEPMLALFEQLGMDQRQAVHASYVLLVYVQGFVLHETAPLSIVTLGPNDERSNTLKQMEQALADLDDRFPRTRKAAEDLAKPDLPARFTLGLDRLLVGLTENAVAVGS